MTKDTGQARTRRETIQILKVIQILEVKCPPHPRGGNWV